jgi:2-polyprenyl-6-methoxyphenol hydroxylase-like FAD-dependent oxidoreductase
MSYSIAILGGGVAGATLAIKLSDSGLPSVLFERGGSLVNGPPMCHLHAGGCLYREIPTQDCLTLLRQSIDTLKCFKYSANLRPTLITVPVRDSGSPETILARMETITAEYARLVLSDPSNQVLGPPADYYRVFTREQVEKLRTRELDRIPQSAEEWMVAPSKYLDLDKFKFPFVLVNEYGLSSMRVAAYTNLLLARTPLCELLTQTEVTNLQRVGNKWLVTYMERERRTPKQR